MPRSARRLTLSPIGFDIVLALGQAPDGLRLADLAHVIGSPVSSVQTALRILVANEIVRREAVEPPRYRVSPDHPARDELVSLATVLPDASHAIAITLRANPLVVWAAVDSLGFLASERDADALPAAAELLDRHLGMIAAARPDAPQVIRMSETELNRLVKVAVGLAARARKALTIKGRAPVLQRVTGADERARRAAG